MGNRLLSSMGVGKSCVLPILVPNPSPTLDKILASMGPGILSSVGVGVWGEGSWGISRLQHYIGYMSVCEKNNSKKSWASILTLLPCRNRCRFSERAIFFLQVHPPSIIKLNQNSQILRWRLAKVAFDTVRRMVGFSSFGGRESSEDTEWLGGMELHFWGLPIFRTQRLKLGEIPGPEKVALGNLQKCVGGFLSYKFWRIFPGIFLEDFSGLFFPQKWGEQIRRENPRKSALKKGVITKRGLFAGGISGISEFSKFSGISRENGRNLLRIPNFSRISNPFSKRPLFRTWVHRGRSDTAANANANSDAPRKFASEV